MPSRVPGQYTPHEVGKVQKRAHSGKALMRKAQKALRKAEQDLSKARRLYDRGLNRWQEAKAELETLGVDEHANGFRVDAQGHVLVVQLPVAPGRSNVVKLR